MLRGKRVTSSFLFLVVMPGATSSDAAMPLFLVGILRPFGDLRSPERFGGQYERG